MRLARVQYLATDIYGKGDEVSNCVFGIIVGQPWDEPQGHINTGPILGLAAPLIRSSNSNSHTITFAHFAHLARLRTGCPAGVTGLTSPQQTLPRKIADHDRSPSNRRHTKYIARHDVSRPGAG